MPTTRSSSAKKAAGKGRAAGAKKTAAKGRAKKSAAKPARRATATRRRTTTTHAPEVVMPAHEEGMGMGETMHAPHMGEHKPEGM